MATLYRFKPRFQALLRPIVQSMAQRGVTPNQVTLAAVALSALSGFCIAAWPTQTWPLFWLPCAVFIRMGLNAIDGMLAREHNLASKLGALLNELGDVIADLSLYLPFALVPGVSARAVFAVVVLGVLTEFAGVAAVQIGASRRYDGPFGKSDRALAFGALAIALGIGIPRGMPLTAVLGVLALLSLVTIANRVRQALRETL